MYQQVATQLIVQSGTTYATREIAMDGANAVEVDFEMISGIGSPELLMSLEQSNDRQNWAAGSPTELTGIGSERARITGIASAFVRLSFSLNSGTTAVVAAGIEPSSL